MPCKNMTLLLLPQVHSVKWMLDAEMSCGSWMLFPPELKVWVYLRDLSPMCSGGHLLGAGALHLGWEGRHRVETFMSSAVVGPVRPEKTMCLWHLHSARMMLGCTQVWLCVWDVLRPAAEQELEICSCMQLHFIRVWYSVICVYAVTVISAVLLVTVLKV